ncbi:tRNA adenosine deaminase-associated protein [Streptomyces griseoloalbus]|uniref:tRNA adenosine deaminase-associated protein n=1 Tax=Streptomyces griseoloalbus TaxID=67303 RepID=UPI0016156F14|nr:hypothetical protein [Streptomyces albaduncus]GGW60776.1 hypothetical protein GCM10010340_43920 [Streptomyces albaduncus]
MYFAALLARTEDGWEASDTELDDVETLSDLADLAREASPDEDTVLVLIEQEDGWFGVVRVDGEEDPRIYVSDAAAAVRSSYGEILLTDELLGRVPGDDGADLDALDLDGTEDGEPDDEDTEADADDGAASTGSAEAMPHGPVGDAQVLEDLGVSEKELRAMTEDAVNEIAEALGASEVLETVR